MKILSVRFKNFASYGNKIQEIVFDKKHSELYLTVGSNGSGKSTIANVIKFLLYGKVDGINMGDLPNRINKNLWGKIEIEVKGKSVSIERGIQPNLFNVVIDGVPYDQAGKLNVQDKLEREFYEIPFNVFKNIVILSINDFKSFLTMNPGDKKNIVDKLFGFSIINELKEYVKKKKRLIDERISIFDKELGIITESVNSVNNKINELEKDSKEENKKLIANYKRKLISLNENRKKLLTAKEKVSKKLNELQGILEKRQREYSSVNAEYTLAKNKVKFYENKKCPHCESLLDTDFHKDKKHGYEDIISKHPNKLRKINEHISKIKGDFISIRDAEHKVISKVSSLETSMKSIKGDLISVNNSDSKGNEFEQLEKLISESRIKEQEKYTEKRQHERDMSFLEIIEDILGDSGIKNLAMKTILPALNSNIAHMTKQIHLPFTIVFDDKFNAEITTLGQEISPKTLSTGERKKADFIIIIALIKIMKLRYPNLNVLFLDEIFSSVDADGRYTILHVLSDTLKDIDINTFVINHSVLPSELFDKQLNIEKKNGFSQIEIEKIV